MLIATLLSSPAGGQHRHGCSAAKNTLSNTTVVAACLSPDLIVRFSMVVFLSLSCAFMVCSKNARRSDGSMQQSRDSVVFGRYGPRGSAVSTHAYMIAICGTADNQGWWVKLNSISRFLGAIDGLSMPIVQVH